jgi:asparagine synthase (glutamine-hydrolysing)
MVQGVYAMPPGTSITIHPNGHISRRRYWDLQADASLEAHMHTPAERRRRVRELLRESMRLHLVSDVPVGVFLSGGVDSSSLVGLMREAGHQPRTFSVGFAERDFDETRYAREIATRFESDHTEIRLPDADLLDQIPSALAAMDQPTGDGVNTYVVARAVRATGIKVALSGLGADELFGGYPSFARFGRGTRLLREWARLPQRVRDVAATATRALGRGSVPADKLATILQSDGSLAETYVVMRQVWSRSQRADLRAADFQDPYAMLLKEGFAADGSTEALARVAYAEARTYMHDLLLRDADQMSMAHALEVRVPFLDHELARYVMGAPDSERRRNRVPKPLLVGSVDDLLPDSVVRRPKQGFALPFPVWMRGPLAALCGAHLQNLGERDFLAGDTIHAYWRKFLDHDPSVSWSRVWTLVALEAWLEHQRF